MDADVPRALCEEGTRRICPDGCGTEACENGDWSRRCEASVETCNGHDDDCNGQIDDSFTAQGLGSSCSIVLDNGCEATGISVCSIDQTNIECNAAPVEPEEDICDGYDNDCDGSIDEGFEAERCCVDAFQCPLGHLCRRIVVSIQAQWLKSKSGQPLPVERVTSLEDWAGFCRDLCFSDDDCRSGFHCTCLTENSCAFEVCLPDDGGGSSNSCTRR